jgi:predicted ATPase
MERDGSATKIEAYLSRFLQSYKRISVQVEGGTVQIFLAERDRRTLIPATRISDGTIRFLSLMAILCHPNPGSLVCIEEPELGLHPDAILLVAGAMKEASKRTQLIVTTHSEALVDALSDEPESVVVCERGGDGSTQFSRLSSSDLDAWLEKYSLGRLWRKGEIGANP